jgi:hypothetical protein
MTKNLKGQMGKVIMNQMIEKLKDPRGVEKDLVIKQTGNKMSEKDYDNLEFILVVRLRWFSSLSIVLA